MAEGAAFIDQRERQRRIQVPLASDPIRPFSFIFPIPPSAPSTLCLPKAFSSPLLVSPGCSFEAMNSVSIKGLLKALLLPPSVLPRFLPLKAENTLGDHWEGERAKEGEGSRGSSLKTFVFPIHETIAGKIKRRT